MIDISEKNNNSWLRTTLKALGPIGLSEKTSEIVDEDQEEGAKIS